MQKEVVITIRPDGSSVVEANGFQGVGCKDATRAIEVALAGAPASDSDRRPKPEFYQAGGSMNTTTR